MSRSLPLAGVLVFGCLLAFTASAQRYDDGSYRPYPGSGQWRDDDGRYGRDDNGPVYDYARVVRVDPIIVDGGGRRGDCYARSEGDYVYDADGYRQERDDARDHGDGRYVDGYRQGNDGGRQVATVIGGLAGAIIGSRICGGDGRYLGTAIGTVAEAGPYRAEMGDGFRPFRRNVRWAGAWETPIKPLLGGLQFAAGAANWGRKLRFGLLSISEEDFRLIAKAMQAKTDPPMAPGGSTEGRRSGR
ncbi:MAG: glycine zipper 2TM domain-containing protein [Stenotrophomonas acidaminiphila]|nr:glycine zipper 2TM domain-containing protein [Stenotrophomonas acidaminiphila]